MDKRIKTVLWTTRATTDLKKLTKFYNDLYGVIKTREIITKIRKSTEILELPVINTREIGEADETFTHLKRNYRRLLNKHCKITYREGKTNMYIVRVFDTRQNPNKNK